MGTSTSKYIQPIENPLNLFLFIAWDPISVFLGAHHFLVSSWFAGFIHIALTVSCLVLFVVHASLRDAWLKKCCYGSPPPSNSAFAVLLSFPFFIGGACNDPNSLVGGSVDSSCNNTSPPTAHVAIFVSAIGLLLCIPLFAYFSYTPYKRKLYRLLFSELKTLGRVSITPPSPKFKALPYHRAGNEEEEAEAEEGGEGEPAVEWDDSQSDSKDSDDEPHYITNIHEKIQAHFSRIAITWEDVPILKYATLASSVFPVTGIALSLGERVLPHQGLYRLRIFLSFVFIITLWPTIWLSLLNSAWGCYTDFDINHVGHTADVLTRGFCNDHSSQVCQSGACRGSIFNAWIYTIVFGSVTGFCGLLFLFLFIVRILGLPFRGQYLVDPYGIAFLTQIHDYLVYESTLLARSTDGHLFEKQEVDPLLLVNHIIKR